MAKRKSIEACDTLPKKRAQANSGTDPHRDATLSDSALEAQENLSTDKDERAHGNNETERTSRNGDASSNSENYHKKSKAGFGDASSIVSDDRTTPKKTSHADGISVNENTQGGYPTPKRGNTTMSASAAQSTDTAQDNRPVEPDSTPVKESQTPSSSSVQAEGGDNTVDLTSVRRSNRARRAPQLYEPKSISLSYGADTTSAKPTSRTGAPRRQPVRGNWSRDYLLQNPRSILAKKETKLLDILAHPRAWTCLTTTEQERLRTLLPPQLTQDPGDASLQYSSCSPITSLRQDPAFKTDLVLFQADLREGRYNPTWLRNAASAMERRARGEFDSWKEREIEISWGLRGDSCSDEKAASENTNPADAGTVATNGTEMDIIAVEDERQLALQDPRQSESQESERNV